MMTRIYFARLALTVLVFSLASCSSVGTGDRVYDPATDDELQEILKAFEPPAETEAPVPEDLGVHNLEVRHDPDGPVVVNADVDNALLSDVLAALLAAADWPYVLREGELRVHVSTQLENVTLAAALESLLEPVGFAAEERNGVIVIVPGRGATPWASRFPSSTSPRRTPRSCSTPCSSVAA